MTTVKYPGVEWDRIPAIEAGFTSNLQVRVERYLDEHPGDDRFRVVVVRHGFLAAEWSRGVRHDEQIRIASAAKSVFSSILGIAIAEGKIASADDRIVDYYPESMDVPDGEGPKPGRYVREKDRSITFRQLISNTSGYLKPGEEPGKVFNYQTFGMNILTHAIAKTYGLYDINDPEGSPGLKQLIDQKLRIPIGANWGYYLMNFQHDVKARTHIFGYYDGIASTALDMARLGWLWCQWGSWKGQQLIPEAWLREAAKVAPDIRKNAPKEQWQYGYGFWTNEAGLLWPDLPRDSFAAKGAGGHQIWVCPSLDLVIVCSPDSHHNSDQYADKLYHLIADSCIQ